MSFIYVKIEISTNFKLCSFLILWFRGLLTDSLVILFELTLIERTFIIGA
jgi:hypothetical protein